MPKMAANKVSAMRSAMLGCGVWGGMLDLSICGALVWVAMAERIPTAVVMCQPKTVFCSQKRARVERVMSIEKLPERSGAAGAGCVQSGTLLALRRGREGANGSRHAWRLVPRQKSVDARWRSHLTAPPDCRGGSGSVNRANSITACSGVERPSTNLTIASCAESLNSSGALSRSTCTL